MTEQRIVTIDLPEDAFKKIIAEPNAPELKSLSNAFSVVAADMDRKQQRNALVNYFDLDSSVSYVPIQAFQDATLSLDKQRIVSLELPEDEFKKIAANLAPAESKSLSDAFSLAAADLDRKEQRNFFVNYFDLSSGIGYAPIQTHKNATLSLTK